MKDWKNTNINLRPPDRPRTKPSPRKEYKHDPECKAVKSPFFSDLLKNCVYYLGIESRHDDIYRCYIWHSCEIEMVTFDNKSYMEEYLNHCKKVRKTLSVTHDRYERGLIDKNKYQCILKGHCEPLLYELGWKYGAYRVPLDIRHLWDKAYAALGWEQFWFPLPEKVDAYEGNLFEIMNRDHVYFDASDQNLQWDSFGADYSTKRFMLFL
jgi:hypothetical protein